MAKKEQKTDTVVEAVLIVDPVEYGLDLAKGREVETQFLPVIVERDSLAVEYTALVSKEITPAVEKEAKDLRLKLVKIRTQTDAIHKTQKAFFLAAGRYIDAWKNKTNVIVEQMEEKLKEIETTSERARVAVAEKLESDRMAELAMYTDFPAQGLAFMPEEVYQNYLVGVKISYQKRVEEAEKQRLADEEKSRKLRLHNERKESILHLWQFITPEQTPADGFGEFAEAGWAEFVAILTTAKAKKEAAEEATKKENERLRKEAEELTERNRKRGLELQPFINFIRDYSGLIAKPDADYKKELADIKKGAELQWEHDRKQDIIEQKKAEEAEAERLRLKAQEDKRLAQEVEEKKKAELASKAPRKQKITTWVEGFQITAPVGLDQDPVAIDILAKFEAFKKWAKTQISNI